LDENINSIKNITEILLDNVKRVGLEVNLDETKCHFGSHYLDVKSFLSKAWQSSDVRQE